MKMLNTRQAAAFLGVDPGWLNRDRFRRGGNLIPYSKFQGVVRYDLVDLEKFILSHKVVEATERKK